MPAVPVAATTQEDEEAAVLSWLTLRPDVAEALDLALAGREEEALPLLTKAVRGILGEGEEHTNGGSTPAVEAQAAPDGDDEEGFVIKKPRRSARCICVIVSGLHGCGKSAMCNILREVLGGTWLNYDEFASKQSAKFVRQAFNAEFRATLAKSLAAADHDQYARLIFVDTRNTVRSRRAELIQELRRAGWRQRGGKVLLVEFSHSADYYGYGADGQLSQRYSEQHVALCIRRIEERGAAHHTLVPSPKLRFLLQGAARGAEAPSPEELRLFDGRVRVDVEKPPPELSLAALEELRTLGWLDGLRSTSELQPKVEVAWQAYQRAESQWRKGAAVSAEPEPHQEWLTQCRRVLEAEKTKEKLRVEERTRHGQAEEECADVPVPLYWKIDVPEVSKVLAQKGILPANFVPVAHPHITLLYLSTETDDAHAAQKAGVSVEQFRTMRQVFENIRGEEFELRMTEIVIEESIACAVVSLPPELPCASKVPHVTLGTKPGVPPRYANQVLEEVKAGRKDGVTSIQLPTPRPLRGKVGIEYAAAPDGAGTT